MGGDDQRAAFRCLRGASGASRFGAENVPRSKPALARDSGGLPTDHWLARAGKRGTKNPATSSATAGWRPGYCSLHEIVADRFRRRHRGRGAGRASAKGLACSPVSTVRSAALVSVVLDAPASAVNAIRAKKRSAMVVRDASMSEIDLPGMEGVTSALLPLAPEAIPGGRVLPPRGEERVPGKGLAARRQARGTVPHLRGRAHARRGRQRHRCDDGRRTASGPARAGSGSTWSSPSIWSGC